MNIDDLKFGDIKKLIKLFGSKLESEIDNHPYDIGENYLIRTVTFAYVGKLKNVFKNELVLENAAWVADTGRFQDAFEFGLENNGESEIELYKDDVIINRGALVDASKYRHPVPSEQK